MSAIKLGVMQLAICFGGFMNSMLLANGPEAAWPPLLFQEAAWSCLPATEGDRVEAIPTWARMIVTRAFKTLFSISEPNLSRAWSFTRPKPTFKIDS